MAKSKEGCVQPAGGPVKPAKREGENGGGKEAGKVSEISVARVGQKAPDFEASAFFNGGFENIKLSSYLGKWVILCFYPGDFTFV